MLLPLLALLLAPTAYAGTPSNSYCASGSSRTSPTYTNNVGSCANNGDVFLRSSIVEVGIHSAGSYGTYRKSHSSFVDFTHSYRSDLQGT